MHAPARKLNYATAPAKQIEQLCSIAPNAAEQFNGSQLGGAHHCIGTGHGIVDAVFRYIQTKCAAHGGTLTDSELAEVQEEFVDDFPFMFDLFEAVHARCMTASCATAPKLFAKGQMLSSLLFTCSRYSAARAFSSEVQDLRGNWLQVFYAALSDFIRQYVSLDAEARLTSAYVKASLKHGQALTIEKYWREETVRNVLRECLRGSETRDFLDALIAALGGTLSNDIDADCEWHSSKAVDQIREFLRFFPDEMRSALGC